MLPRSTDGVHSVLGFIGPVFLVMLAVPVFGTGEHFAEWMVLMPLLQPQTAELAV